VADGAGIDNAYNLGVAAKATIISSTIQDNIANVGGGVNNAGEFWLLNSLVYSNTAGLGGGLRNWNDAGQIGDLHVINSTVSGNRADQDGGGLYNEGDGTTAVLGSSTVFGNLSLIGNSGNLYSINGTIILSNSIVASPLNLNNANCEGSIVSDGYNLDTDNTCGLGAGEKRGITNPLIDSLKDNGGPTLTHALLSGSPAIDASPVCEPTDQRGVPRPDGIACD
ncbi:MAG: choice-of-anchor Q domain-containing protein, partial [Anaerolineae bacterium]